MIDVEFKPKDVSHNGRQFFLDQDDCLCNRRNDAKINFLIQAYDVQRNGQYRAAFDLRMINEFYGRLLDNGAAHYMINPASVLTECMDQLFLTAGMWGKVIKPFALGHYATNLIFMSEHDGKIYIDAEPDFDKEKYSLINRY